MGHARLTEIIQVRGHGGSTRSCSRSVVEVSRSGVHFDGKVLEFDDRLVLGYDRKTGVKDSSGFIQRNKKDGST